jgi:phenylalanyl-tRNA synthetase beta chain
MKVSELWLRSFIETSLSISEIAEKLTNAGIEVDSLEYIDDPQTKQGVLTLKIPPNRSDCLGMEGIARELSLLTKTPYKPITVTDLTAKINETIPIHLDACDLCPHYLGRIIKNINPGRKAPSWMKERLELAGIRSVSAVVDILNYVMIELGQPLHAFDLDTLNNQIMVRLSTPGETIQLLNEQTIALEVGTLVIADKKEPHAIAGVMGGLKSSVTDKTTNILIESAYFNPIAIRLAGQRYGLRTDASHRFERGVAIDLQKRALNRATQLLLEIMGGEAGPVMEERNEAALPTKPEIVLRNARIAMLLGLCPEEAEILDILKRAEMKAEVQEGGFRVSPPHHRQDIALEVDLIEEVARVYGYEKFLPKNITGTFEFFAMPETKISVPLLKKTLIERGYFESITYSFIDPKLIEIFYPLQKPYLLANPISSDMAAMRPSLWPGLLQAVQYNQRRQQLRVRLFEIGDCYSESEGKSQEKSVIAGISTGSYYPEQWGVKNRQQDFYDIKGDVEALLSRVAGLTGTIELDSIQFQPLVHPALHPGKAAKIIHKGQSLGIVGALHPRIMQALDISNPIFVFELELTQLKGRIPEFRDMSKFPGIRRDIALVVDHHLFVEEIKSAIVRCVGPWLREVAIFDVYQGAGIEPGKKSVALGLILQHPSRTLVEEEVTDKVQEVITMLGKQFHAILRE